MRNGVKEIIVKGSVILTGCMLFIFTIGFPVICTILGYQFETVENVWYVLFLITVVFGTIMIVLLITIKLPSKSLAPEKFHLFYRKEELNAFLEKKLKENAYRQMENCLYGDDLKFSLYIKHPTSKNVNCFVIIWTTEVSKELLESLNDEITHVLTINLHECYINNINMMSIFCVDRLGTCLRKLLFSNLQQGLRNGRMIAVISFGSKQVFLARQNDGFAYRKYKHLRKEIIKILEL